MKKFIKINLLFLATTLGLVKTAQASQDCSKIESYKVYQRSSANNGSLDLAKEPNVYFFADAVSQERNRDTNCITIEELSYRNAYGVDGYGCGAISYGVRHFDENRNFLKFEIATMPYKAILRRSRVDDKIYNTGAVLGEAMDLAGPLVAVVAGPIAGVGDTIADTIDNADERNRENMRAAYNQVLRILDSGTSLKQCQK